MNSPSALRPSPLLAAAILATASVGSLAGCYGSIPPEPPCYEAVPSDGVVVETRIRRDLSRRPREVWHVRRDSAGNWIRHGRATGYFLNGQTASLEWYRNGRLDGPASYWHENGAKQGEIAYRGGLAEGEARTWYDNGMLESERAWKAGRLEGTERRWDRRGRLLSETVWHENKIVTRKELER